MGVRIKGMARAVWWRRLGSGGVSWGILEESGCWEAQGKGMEKPWMGRGKEKIPCRCRMRIRGSVKVRLNGTISESAVEPPVVIMISGTGWWRMDEMTLWNVALERLTVGITTVTSDAVNEGFAEIGAGL